MMRIKRFRELGVLIVLGVIVIILSIVSPVFLKPVNLVNIVRQTVEIGVMAIGMSFLIIAAEMDLSVGSIFGAAAMLGALLFKNEVNPTLVFIVMLLAGAAIGLVNGTLVAKAKMPAFIVTLGTMQIFRSIAYAISNGQSISVFPDKAMNSWVFGLGASVGVIPVQVIIMLILYVIAHIVMSKTKLGFDIYATGGNQKAARLAGINTDRIKIICFMLTGSLCALAGMISIAYLKSVPTTAGEGREMDVIAAVILGGAALSGGRGTILGTFIGAIIMSVVKNGMVLMSVPVFWQTGFIGVIIILAVLLDTWIGRKERIS
ncbi:ABC transporter permease [Murimonas intestini]|uniref:Simple sugar transport system permease protein/ribose transport system permease protein n=1 Tax=Murimonas intestini TaxID=1337051 RepID=A0AB73T150_9FIRM|nr:ABC transporter permease [Murimonas intestini]MCR1840392.1 ABC transporter permease [Murimonas intestini]MCR1867497.1 ABC transporter permease [Murimonas intestini]MCR1884684.1 ABC transporter permease [Murimonas intestini]